MDQIGVFTLPTFLQYNSDQIDIETILKRSAIFFESIVLSESIPLKFEFIPNVIAHNMRGSLVPNIKKRLDQKFAKSKDFNTVFKSNQEYDYLFNMVKEKKSEIEESIKSSNNLPKFIECVRTFDNPNSDTIAKEFEFQLILDSILSDHILYLNINKHLPNFLGILSPRMRNVIEAVTNEKKLTEEEMIKFVGNIKFFDFGLLSWGDIIELRKSEFAKDFRVLVNDLLNNNKGMEEVDEINSKLNGFIMNAQVSFMKENYPNPKKAIISTILGNIPLPTVFNPFSIYSGIKDIKHQAYLKKKYSWLYYIMESQENKKKANT